MPLVTSDCVEVPREKGEVARKKLSESGYLRRDLAIRVEEGVLLIPVTGPGAEGVCEDCRASKADFEVVESLPGSYKEIIKGVPSDLMGSLPTAFDIIGHVALVKLRPGIEPYAGAIGDAMLRANPALRTVVKDDGVKGRFRVRDLRVIAGEADTVVVHREHGMIYHLDIAKAYFSPRLATERDRVADLVRDGEDLLDMFAGVGPFSILIAKRVRGCRVTAVEINDDAFSYLVKNIEGNRTGNIEPVRGDAAEACREWAASGRTFDRIIMNLPHGARKFLGPAAGVLKKGGTIHYYEITEDPDEVSSAVIAMLEGFERKAVVRTMRMVRNYAPGIVHLALDMVVE